ncbi:MAG: response regulator transcription factor [Clostridium argentinense]|uniref:response regulator transcription factor n=1 Tax=uncultured Clostridium sp. TaxID=59620 RepID=UPI001DFDC096|nr:response regulator transcription factor [uncultured Clostridium sp.]MBS5824151.1 response regulator transcription factor [Clostridium argentinense]MDU1350445.1 response regulator transcription factor [Clostridium argentinense]
MAKILIVEDDSTIRNLILLTLQMENYDAIAAEDGEVAISKLDEEDIDLILLDIMLPKIDGYGVLHEIQKKNIPVIFLTAKSSIQDKVMGLKLGADDYVTKPFEPLELLARIEALLRRSKVDKKSEAIVFKHIMVLENERTVTMDNEEIYLTPKEFDLLLEFLNHKNIVLTREVLLNKIWGYDFYGETRTVDMHVKRLREKLNLKDYLQTIYKVGYKLKE